MGYQLPNDYTCYQTMQDAENAFLVKLPTMIDQKGHVQSLSRVNNHLEFNNTQIVLQLQNCDYEQSLMNHNIEFILTLATAIMFFIALLLSIRIMFSPQIWDYWDYWD